MKITTDRLRQVVKEELEKVLQEEKREYEPAEIISKMEDNLKSQYKTDELKALKTQFKNIIEKLKDPEYYSIDDIKYENGEGYLGPKDKEGKYIGGYYSGWEIKDYNEVINAIDRAIKNIDHEDADHYDHLEDY